MQQSQATGVAIHHFKVIGRSRIQTSGLFGGPPYTMFSGAGNDYKMCQSDQSMICGKEMKNVTSGVFKVDRVALPVWSPHDLPTRLLKPQAILLHVTISGDSAFEIIVPSYISFDI